VVDDSDSQQSRAANLANLREVESRFGGRVWYCATSEREEYLNRLAAYSGVAPALLRFAILGPELRVSTRIGSCRNTLLLHTVGNTFLSVDDDTICNVGRSPDYREGITFTEKADPTTFRFYETNEQAATAVTFEPADILGLHEMLLGKTVSNLAVGAGEAACFNDVTSTMLGRIESGGSIV
jgi:hypothetical protein